MKKPPMALDDPLRTLSVHEVGELLGLHEITVWRWVRQGRLPRPIRLGPRKNIWLARTIGEWLAQKAAETARATTTRRWRPPPNK